MKIAMMGFVAVLTCSCHQVANHSRAVYSQKELRKIMDAYWRSGNPYYTKQTFDLRGPLTVAQVKDELIALHERTSGAGKTMNGATESFEDSNLGEAWRRLESKHEEDDQFYFYIATAKPSWSQSQGYVLIRNTGVLDGITTFMN
jgi:hypothetical protein